MKNVKIILSTLFIVIITAILSSSVYAGTVNGINAIENEGKITVSGTVDSSVYAVAVVVYTDDSLEYMETTNVNTDGTYNVELEKTFDYGTYEVRVADYNGGENKKVLVEVKNEESTTDNTVEENTTIENETTDNTVEENTTIENETSENTSTDKKEKSSNPTTGDKIVIFATIFAVAVVGLGMTRKLNKSKRRISKH